MNLVGLLKSDFALSNDMLVDVQKIDEHIGENFSFKNEYVIENISSHFLRETHLQNEIAVSKNKTSLGFEKLERQLTNCQFEDLVYVRFVESLSWKGRVYFLEGGSLLGVFLGEKNNKNYKTPPNWDGSLESLRKYNERFNV